MTSKKNNNNSEIQTADIAVIGGGHSGLIQTLLLIQNGFNVICIDREDPQILTNPDHDGRTTAISFGSYKLLKAAGIWKNLLPYACPIQDIQILDGTSPVLLDFDVNDVKDTIDDKDSAFGWIIENHIIHKILHDEIAKNKNAVHLTNTKVINFNSDKNSVTVTCDNGNIIKAKLIIGADGRQSFTREWMNVGAKEWSYDQQAIVSIITHEKPHNNIAIEHFKAEGPFAILPMLDDKQGNHRSSIVWTQHKQNAQTILGSHNDTFLIALNTLFPDFYGKVLKAGKRFSYPLNFIHAYNYIIPRMALIADAAHGIHPIAGQGLNLGLRDVAALTEILIEAKKQNQDIGQLDVLKQYSIARRTDNMLMAMTTDALNKLFSNNHIPIRLTRKLGLKIINHFKPAKKFFMRQAMGTSGHLPKIIRNGKI